MKRNSQEFDTGFEAYLRGEALNDNHYARGTYSHDEWANGWREAAGANDLPNEFPPAVSGDRKFG